MSFENDVRHTLVESNRNTQQRKYERKRRKMRSSNKWQRTPFAKIMYYGHKRKPRGSDGTTIGALDRIFSTHGFPKTLVSDSGTQFTSVDFKEFCQQRSIEHIRIPPYHPQSNGQAEREREAYKKAIGEGTMGKVLQNFLLRQRSTPHSGIGKKFPAEVLMGRKLRTVHETMLPKKTRPDERRGNKKNILAVNAPVYARDYRLGHQWTAAITTKRHGSMIYYYCGG
ncbi:unnamed protein product [Hymenolepis diminuta]|uniref:Integrase catalytic domain-containing protein n=1 Tax=Hymenolepis diminuta TaxID=6216 RepID=A0A564Z7H8_HYMDI|nr:unnamed protein product [Hymenolepis diminuta]